MQTSETAERAKYINAFVKTQMMIWQDRIEQLGVIDTGQLFASVPGGASMATNNDYTNAEFALTFLEYGLWQNYGTGKETPRGNTGDIGRAKVRKVRKWMSKPLARSLFNIRDFFARNIGREFMGIVTDALNRKTFARQHNNSAAAAAANNAKL